MSTLTWPFDPSTISEGYGNSSWRVSNNNPSGLHDGIDFAIPAGTELRAAASGVVYNNDAGSDGAGVDIATDDGWKVRMWHVSQFLVANESYVNAGDVVALSGGTPGTWGAGFTTGAHMHFGVKVGGVWVDPAPIINGSAPSTPSADGSITDLAAAVLRGDFGNGPARQAALGARFDEVQAEVNRLLNGGAPAATPAPAVSGNVAIAQPGDGYWHIAQRVWGGDNATIEANMNKLIELNGNKRLYAGNEVIIEAPAPLPVVEPVVAPAPVVETVPAPVAEPVVTPEPVATVVTPEPTKPPAEEKKPVSLPAIKTVSNSQIQDIRSNLYSAKELNEAAEYDLVDIRFWNYAGERVIKSFAYALVAQLAGTGTTVYVVPQAAEVLAQLGPWYVLMIAGNSAIISLGVALSTFRNIVTIPQPRKRKA